MGDNHVCSFCNEKQFGKQHIKIVFENWPVEEEVTYRRKGKVAHRTRKVTKEVITAIGMECLRNPEHWKDFAIDPGKVEEFFEDLRFAGKNPFFRAVLTKNGSVCLAASNCPHFSQLNGAAASGSCEHIGRGPFDVHHLDMLYCMVGHRGIELVRQPLRNLMLQGNLRSWAMSLRQLWQFGASWKRSPFLTVYYFFWLFSGWFAPYFIIWMASLPIAGVFMLGQRLKWKTFREKSFRLEGPPALW